MSRPFPAWSDDNLRDPHAAPDKARRVRDMFAAIAPSYDLNNRLHSLGLDQAWRRAAARAADLRAGDAVLDVACGTGDLALALAKALCKAHAGKGAVPRAGQVIGLDFTFPMLPLARGKAARGFAPVRSHPHPARLGDTLRWVHGDALALPLPDASVDVVSIAFGIRNVTDPRRALAEFFRVLRPGGRLVVLEFSLPRRRLLRGLYQFYFQRVLPRTATWMARDRSGAYRYLPRSVNTFIAPAEMADLLRAVGFRQVTQRPLALGIACIHRASRTAAP